MVGIDMKMPSSCLSCKLSYYLSYGHLMCPYRKDEVSRYATERHPYCPLRDLEDKSNDNKNE